MERRGSQTEKNGRPSWLIGIAGGSGSGKSWLAEKLKSRFEGQVACISQDWYYRDLSHLSLEEASKTNFDHPKSIEDRLLETHINELLQGRTISAPDYQFSNYTRIENQHVVQPFPIILFEGIFALHFPNIRALLDDSVFIEAAADIRLIRRIRRDLQERGYSLEQILDLWETRAYPMFKTFVEPSAKWAQHVWKTEEDNAFVEAFLVDLKNRLASNAGTENPER